MKEGSDLIEKFNKLEYFDILDQNKFYLVLQSKGKQNKRLGFYSIRFHQYQEVQIDDNEDNEYRCSFEER